MARAKRAALAALLFWRWRRTCRHREPSVPGSAPGTEPGEGPADPRFETLVVVMFLAATVCAAAFVTVYALDRLPAHTQLLGLALGLAFAFIGAALIVVGKRLVPVEELEEEYPEPHAADQDEVERMVREGGERLTRRRLLAAAGGAAATALGLALVTPAVSLGPVFDTDNLYRTPWRRGRRLVDERGRPFQADEIEQDVFYTAYPEGVDPEQLGAPLVLVRLRPSLLRLPRGREAWAPAGILAYSKICTHAGCAIGVYRAPHVYRPAEPAPALICPCHYSTFDPAAGGAVLFGPAGRPLPQLPLVVDGHGELRAGGTFSGPVGPSWWGVRMGEARP